MKVKTVPSQSLSLREIIRRFVRHESLPVHKDGVYEDRMGDLEKLSNADITEQLERAEDIKSKIAKADARMKAKDVADRESAEKARQDAARSAAYSMAKSAGGGGAGEGPPAEK